MRVGTLFEPGTAEFLQKHFVLVRHNQCPQLYCGDGVDPKKSYSKEHLETAVDGSGGGNVRSYFCRSDGRVVSYVAGRWSPEKFLREARWALQQVDRDISSISVAHEAVNDSYRRERDAAIPPTELDWAMKAPASKLDRESKARAAELRRKAMAYNRMIRSHREVQDILFKTVDAVLLKVEQEIYTKGALG